ncbi:hypothetical protein MTO96_026473 [Rhipicephalus appendiculatus]
MVTGQPPPSTETVRGEPQGSQMEPNKLNASSLHPTNTPPAAKVSTTQDAEQTRFLESDAMSLTDHGPPPATADTGVAQLGEMKDIRPGSEPGTSNLPSSDTDNVVPEVSEIHPRPDTLPEGDKHRPSTEKVDGAPQDSAPNPLPAVQRPSSEEANAALNLKETPLAKRDPVPSTSQHFPHSPVDDVAPAAEEARGRTPIRPDMLPVKPQHPTSFATAQLSGAPPTGGVPPTLRPEHELPAVTEHEPLGLEASERAPRRATSHEDARPPGFLNSSTDVLPEKISATSLLESMSGCLHVPPGTIDGPVEGAAPVTKQRTPTHDAGVQTQAVTPVVPGSQLSADKQSEQSSAATSHPAEVTQTQAGTPQSPFECKEQLLGKEAIEEFHFKVASALTATAAAPSPAAPSAAACRPILTFGKRYIPDALIMTHEEKGAEEVSRVGASDERGEIHLVETSGSDAMKRSTSDDDVAVELKQDGSREVQTVYAVPEMRPLVASYHQDKGRRSTGVMSPASPIETLPAARASDEPSAMIPAVVSKKDEVETNRPRDKVRPLVASFGQGFRSPSRTLSSASSPKCGSSSPECSFTSIAITVIFAGSNRENQTCIQNNNGFGKS